MCLNNTIRLYFHFRVSVQLRIGLSPPHGELVCSIILLAGTVEVFEFICVCKGMSKTTFVSSPIKQVNFKALIAGLLDQCRVYLSVRSCRINQIHHSIKYLILGMGSKTLREAKIYLWNRTIIICSWNRTILLFAHSVFEETDQLLLTSCKFILFCGN